jgi:hypothetical protein
LHFVRSVASVSLMQMPLDVKNVTRASFWQAVSAASAVCVQKPAASAPGVASAVARAAARKPAIRLVVETFPRVGQRRVSLTRVGSLGRIMTSSAGLLT